MDKQTRKRLGWWRRDDGQATVEYILMLASIVVVLSAFLMAFHTNIAFFFFQFIGQLLMS